MSLVFTFIIYCTILEEIPPQMWKFKCLSISFYVVYSKVVIPK